MSVVIFWHVVVLLLIMRLTIVCEWLVNLLIIRMSDFMPRELKLFKRSVLFFHVVMLVMRLKGLMPIVVTFILGIPELLLIIFINAVVVSLFSMMLRLVLVVKVHEVMIKSMPVIIVVALVSSIVTFCISMLTRRPVKLLMINRPF